MANETFEWNRRKNVENQDKHGVSFDLAQHAFADPKRVVAKDNKHSENEQRYFCFAKVGRGIMTVRFTYRQDVVRIFGAGYWRKGRETYEKRNNLHR